MSESRVFICSDGHRLAYNLWTPETKEIKAFVQILHGMAEYSDRYEHFARYLNKKGYAVFSADYRGHGHTAEKEDLGWFAEENGWQVIASDSFEIARYISTIYRAKQIFLFGHSMGSFLARTMMLDHADFYSGVVAMGTGCSLGLLGKLGKALAKMQCARHGKKAPGDLMNKMTFKDYNKKIENPRTAFDWLSTDEKQVDKYVNDPLCGFICSNGFFYDMISGIEIANNREKASTILKDLPVLLISGSEDPVGNYGKGVAKVHELYKDAGLLDVECKLFEGLRHELLNEVDRKTVYDYLYSWFEKHV